MNKRCGYLVSFKEGGIIGSVIITNQDSLSKLRQLFRYFRLQPMAVIFNATKVPYAE